MKKIIIILLFLPISLTQMSCNSFLNQVSTEEVIPKTTVDLNELLWGAAYHCSNMGITNLLDDNIERNKAFVKPVQNTAHAARVRCYTWQGNMYDVGETVVMGIHKNQSNYYTSYSSIKGCNAVLDHIDDAIGTDAEKKLIKAQAYALRGFYYLQLVNMYGKPYNVDKKALGVPLKLNSGLVEHGIKRNTVEECYTQIVKDLQTSLQLFNEHGETGLRIHRITPPAVKVILSRVYLYMENWSEAAKIATEAINEKPDLAHLPTASASLFIMDESNIETLWVYSTNETEHILATKDMVYKPSVDLIKNYKSNDARLTNFFNPGFHYNFKKLNPASYMGIGRGRAIRIMEAYLNRAEANVMMAKAGDGTKAQEALRDLQTIRVNRLTDYVNEGITDVTTLESEIKLERRLELCFEDHRWFDLRRWGMPEIQHISYVDGNDPGTVFTLHKNDPMYTLPIPNFVMAENIDIVQNESSYIPERKGQPVL